jgi:hypothetical protein
MLTTREKEVAEIQGLGVKLRASLVARITANRPDLLQ